MSLPKVLQKIINNVGYGQALTGNDNDIVHKTDNEEITGQKVFNQPSLMIKDTLVDAADYPSSGTSYTELFFVGNNHVLGAPFDNDPSRLGELQYYKTSSGDRGLEMTIRWSENSGGSADVGLCRNSSGAVFGYCPSTPLPSVHNEGTDIVTRDFIPNDTRIVHTTGTQAIGGYKYFTSNSVGMNNPDVDYTKTQSGNTNSYLYFNDKNGVTMSCLQNHVTTSDNRLRLMIRKQKDTTTVTSDLPHVQLIYDNDGTLMFEGSGNGLWYLGSSGTGRWKEVWASNNAIQTSDERLKTEITAVPEDILNVWENVDFCKFKMLEAVNTKGLNNARFHSGVIAQQIKSTFENAGLDVTKYSFFCYNHWDAKEAEYDQYGNLDTPAKPEGDEYSIRYGELLCIEAAYNRRRVSRLEEKIKLLEQKLNLAS